MTPNRKRLDLREELPPLAPHFQRFRAIHNVLGQEVEVRIAREEDRGTPEDPFRRDLIALSLLDSPAFPPILDRGRVQERLFYALPLRTAPCLETVLEESSFTLSQRCWALRSLATGLSQAHQRGISLGALEPTRIAWEQETLWAYYLSVQQRDASVSPLLPLPPWSENLEPLERDVVSWALLVYWLLARVRSPRSGSMLVPLCARVRELHLDLGEMVDACLEESGGGRPGNGVELQALLAIRSRDFREAQGGEPTPRAEPSLRESLEQIRTQQSLPKVGRFVLPRGLDLDFDLGGRLSRLRELPGWIAWSLGLVFLVAVLVFGGWFQGSREPDPFEVFDQLEASEPERF